MTREYTIPGLHITEHTLTVPLDWSDPQGRESITVFAREVVAPQRRRDDLPLLLFLQGGPGGKSPRPLKADGWIGEALKTHRVILLDQRGTGRSTPVDARTITARGGAAAGADYLTCFRADSIIKDAEHLRAAVYGGRRWTTLGQSYGGFLTLTYLSQAPEGLAACLVTGGLASLTPDAGEVYRRTYPRTEAKNRELYHRYPHLVQTVGRLADRLAADPVTLPDGDVLTVPRLQSLGMDFGMKPGFERMLWLLDEAFDADGDPSDTFLAQVWARTCFRTNPLYAALQENIYCSGSMPPTAWAAQREHDRQPRFAADARPLLFTGEMVYPWMFEQIAGLRPFRPAVQELAMRTEWSSLYDPDRLGSNEIPVAAAVYYDDMYVDSDLQLQTAASVGNLRRWVTSEFEHDGIGDPHVFAHLMTMIDAFGGPLPDGR